MIWYDMIWLTLKQTNIPAEPAYENKERMSESNGMVVQYWDAGAQKPRRMQNAEGPIIHLEPRSPRILTWAQGGVYKKQHEIIDKYNNDNDITTTEDGATDVEY